MDALAEKTTELLSEIHDILPVPLSIDSDSVTRASLDDATRDRGLRWLAVGALKSLTCSDGLARILADPTYGPVFRDKTRRILVTYERSVNRNLSIHWDAAGTLVMSWGRDAFSYSYCTTYYSFKNALASQVESLHFTNRVLPFATNIIARLWGPQYSVPRIEVDWDSFEDAEEDSQRALKVLYEYNGRFSTLKIVLALLDVARYEEEVVVDAVAQHLRSIRICLQPGKNTDLKSYEIPKRGELVLRLVLESGSYAGVYDEKELRSLLVWSALLESPQARIPLLQAVATSPRVVTYGDVAPMQRLFESSTFFHNPDAAIVTAAKEQCKTHLAGSQYIKVFSNLLKQNMRGKRQKRCLLITADYYCTFQWKSSGAIREANFKVHRLEDIICIDLYRISTKGKPKELGFCIYTAEMKEKVSMVDRLTKRPEGKPPVSAAHANDDGRDIPETPTLDDFAFLPATTSNVAAFDRYKERRPARTHPPSKGAHQTFMWMAEADANQTAFDAACLVQEAAWTLYAAYAAKTRKGDYEPFYLDERRSFDAETMVDDVHRVTTDEFPPETL
jgi:hypothetical protein